MAVVDGTDMRITSDCERKDWKDDGSRVENHAEGRLRSRRISADMEITISEK